jgi:hypothetical protein
MAHLSYSNIQGGSNMTGTNSCVNKPHAFPVIFEPPCRKLIYNDDAPNPVIKSQSMYLSFNLFVTPSRS